MDRPFRELHLLVRTLSQKVEALEHRVLSTDDDLELLTRKQAAKLCNMDVKTFDNRIRPLLTSRLTGTGRVRFLKGEIRSVLRRLYGFEV